MRLGSIDALVDEALQTIRGLKEAFAEGSLGEQKELVSLMVEKIDVDPVGKTARAYNENSRRRAASAPGIFCKW